MTSVVDWVVGLMRLIGAPGVGVATALETVFRPSPPRSSSPSPGSPRARGTTGSSPPSRGRLRGRSSGRSSSTTPVRPGCRAAVPRGRAPAARARQGRGAGDRLVRAARPDGGLRGQVRAGGAQPDLDPGGDPADAARAVHRLHHRGEPGVERRPDRRRLRARRPVARGRAARGATSPPPSTSCSRPASPSSWPGGGCGGPPAPSPPWTEHATRGPRNALAPTATARC